MPTFWKLLLIAIVFSAISLEVSGGGGRNRGGGQGGSDRGQERVKKDPYGNEEEPVELAPVVTATPAVPGTTANAAMQAAADNTAPQGGHRGRHSHHGRQQQGQQQQQQGQQQQQQGQLPQRYAQQGDQAHTAYRSVPGAGDHHGHHGKDHSNKGHGGGFSGMPLGLWKHKEQHNS